MRRELERLTLLELRDDVVVIRVEPLRHFHRGDIAAFALAAARHREVRIEVDFFTSPAVARRHSANQRAGVEHAVVKGEVIDGDAVDADVALQRPVAASQFGPRLQ